MHPLEFFVPPAVVVAGLRDRARRAGAVRLTRRVTGLALGPGGTAELATDRGPLVARVAVVAAGAGTPALLRDRAPGGLRTKRIGYAFFRAPAGLPLPTVVDLVTGVWGRPAPGGAFLAGSPVEEWDVPPDGGEALPGDRLAALRAEVALRWPDLAAASLLGSRYGADLYAPAGPLLGVLPGAPPVVAAAGWSGGGFKTAPAAAERAAGHALGLL